MQNCVIKVQIRAYVIVNGSKILVPDLFSHCSKDYVLDITRLIFHLLEYGFGSQPPVHELSSHNLDLVYVVIMLKNYDSCTCDNHCCPSDPSIIVIKFN